MPRHHSALSRRECLVIAALALGLAGNFALAGSASPGTTAPPASGVWYEIFVRSWADTNGDGIGDLNGVTARLD